MILRFPSGTDALCVEPCGTVRLNAPRPAALLPGSFNPLHHGHTRLASVAAERLGVSVAFELSIANVDKPELAEEEVTRRAAQFKGRSTLWITRGATFREKVRLFPGTVFVLGFDTAIRLVDAKYYEGDPILRDDALRIISAAGTRFLVAGRIDASGTFHTWRNDDVQAEFHGLFEALTEPEFRADVSSTALRSARSTTTT